MGRMGIACRWCRERAGCRLEAVPKPSLRVRTRYAGNWAKEVKSRRRACLLRKREKEGLTQAELRTRAETCLSLFCGRLANYFLNSEARPVLCPVTLDDAWEAKVKEEGQKVLWRKVKEKVVLDFGGWEADAFDGAFAKLHKGLPRYYGASDSVERF